MKDTSSKTLEQLENDYWGDAPQDTSSYLIRTCHELRRKKLKDFQIEDLRLLIGQNIGLKYVVPMAIDILKEDAFAEGDFYAGDLLHSLLTSDNGFWQTEQDLKEVVIREIVHKNEFRIDELDSTKEIKNTLKKSIRVFKGEDSPPY